MKTYFVERLVYYSPFHNFLHLRYIHYCSHSLAAAVVYFFQAAGSAPSGSNGTGSEWPKPRGEVGRAHTAASLLALALVEEKA